MESHSGVLHLNRVKFIKLENMTFENNHNCSALYVHCSNINFEGMLNFINNTGQIGAAIALIATRQLVNYHCKLSLKLGQNTRVRMMNNTAEQYGGGVYVDDDCRAQSKCIFDGINNTASQFEMINNAAKLGGDSVFGGCFEPCFKGNDSEQHLFATMSGLQSLFGIPCAFQGTLLQ